jgi:hypothetical protein
MRQRTVRWLLALGMALMFGLSLTLGAESVPVVYGEDLTPTPTPTETTEGQPGGGGGGHN